MTQHKPEIKEIHLVSGEGSVIIELNEEGLKVSIFGASEQLDHDERNNLLKWLVCNVMD